MENDSTRRHGLGRRPDEIARRKDIYVEVYAATGSAEAAVLAAGYSPRGVHSAMSTFAKDADLMERARAARDAQVSLDVARFRKQQEALRAKADDAINVLAEIQSAEVGVNAKWHYGAQARVQAAIAILDRAGHRPVERIEQTVHWDDISRETGGIDAAVLFSVALAELKGQPDALPGDFRALPDHSQDAPDDPEETTDDA